MIDTPLLQVTPLVEQPMRDYVILIPRLSSTSFPSHRYTTFREVSDIFTKRPQHMTLYNNGFTESDCYDGGAKPPLSFQLRSHIRDGSRRVGACIHQRVREKFNEVLHKTVAHRYSAT